MTENKTRGHLKSEVHSKSVAAPLSFLKI